MAGTVMSPLATMRSAAKISPRKNSARRGSHASVASAWKTGTPPVIRPNCDSMPQIARMNRRGDAVLGFDPREQRRVLGRQRPSALDHRG